MCPLNRCFILISFGYLLELNKLGFCILDYNFYYNPQSFKIWRFRKLDVGNNGYLQRQVHSAESILSKIFCQQDLLRIPELAINPLGDRIIHAFFFDNEDDKLEFKVLVQEASDSYIISFRTLSTFFPSFAQWAGKAGRTWRTRRRTSSCSASACTTSTTMGQSVWWVVVGGLCDIKHCVGHWSTYKFN